MKTESDAYVFLERYGKPGGGKGILVSTNFCPTLTGLILNVCAEVDMDESLFNNNRENVDYSEKNVCPTLLARMGTGGGNTPLVRQNIENQYIVRRITPTECERLQGFPDGYTDIPWPKAEHAPNNHRYKALGNSMTTNVMAWIGKRIENALQNPIQEDKSEKESYQLWLF